MECLLKSGGGTLFILIISLSNNKIQFYLDRTPLEIGGSSPAHFSIWEKQNGALKWYFSKCGRHAVNFWLKKMDCDMKTITIWWSDPSWHHENRMPVKIGLGDIIKFNWYLQKHSASSIFQIINYFLFGQNMVGDGGEEFQSSTLFLLGEAKWRGGQIVFFKLEGVEFYGGFFCPVTFLT